MSGSLRFLPLLIGGALAASPLCAQDSLRQQLPQGRYIDGVIANVSGRIILYSDLANRLEQAKQNGVTVTDELACEQFEELLYQQLLLDQARIDSVVAEPAQVNAELEQRIAYFEQQIGSREKLEKFYGKTVTEIKADFYDQVADQLLSQRMQEKIVGRQRITPREVEQFYNSIPADSLPFINAAVELARISITAKPTELEQRKVRQKLEEYRESIVRGEKDFCTIAILYSQDPGSAGQCGELGMVPQGVMVPEFDAVAMSLKDGEVSPVFHTRFGYHIMQMIERKGDRYNARHILLTPTVTPADMAAAKTRLDSLMTLVRDGAIGFDEVATKYNDDEETKGTNGLLLEPYSNAARWAIGDLDQKTFLVVDKLEVGQISQAIQYEEADGTKGYRVFRLIKRTEPHRMELVQDYPLVERAAEASLKQREVEAWVRNKLRDTYIKVSEDFQGCRFEHPWLGQPATNP